MPIELLGIRESRLLKWVEQQTGGRVTNVSAQERWRPGWSVDVEGPMGQRSFFARGERELPCHPYSLDREYEVLKVLEVHGLPVPAILGLCEDPRAIVMDLAPGSADSGMVLDSIASHTHGIGADRTAALNEYVELLAEIHRIDVGAFGAAFDEAVPATPTDIATNQITQFYEMYRGVKHQPEPTVEFLYRWLRTHAPQDRSRASFVTGDSGQFLAAEGKITALLDFENGYLGDPLADLACFRLRDCVEPMGDISALYRRYSEITGECIEPKVISYFTALFCSVPTLGLTIGRTDPAATPDFVEFFAQSALASRLALESIAEILGITLEPMDPPQALPSRHTVAADKLVSGLMPDADAAGLVRLRQAGLLATALYLRNVGELGDSIEEDDLDDLAELLGTRPSDWLAADHELECYVLSADSDRDEDLVRLLHRRETRKCYLVTGPTAPGNNPLLAPLKPVASTAKSLASEI